jgi:SAM-dependent methyltransferase
MTLTFTGERFLPDCLGEIAYEHWHRYTFARRLATGKRVLDAACGEGYGSALLAANAAEVIGVDIDVATLEHAAARYAPVERLRFVHGSCSALPIPDASVDLVVSFETVEHLSETDQVAMLREFARVLSAEGVLVISSPNKRLYSDLREYRNEFHLHELYRDGLTALLGGAFPAQHWYHQRLGTWSGIWYEGSASEGEAWVADGGNVERYSVPEGMYFIVVAARRAQALPAPGPGISLLADAADSEGSRAVFNAGEVLRLDGLLRSANAALASSEARLAEQQDLAARRGQLLAAREAQLEANAERERAGIAERDHSIDALRKECVRLNGVADALEREVTRRQGIRWWLALPLIRFGLMRAARRN